MQRREFEILVSQLRPRLLITAKNILGSEEEAADAVQDALIKLWFFKDRLDGYDNPAAPAAVILRRVCLSALRARKTTIEIEAAMTIEADTYSEAISPELMMAIEALPPMEQAVLKMKHLEDMETEEIAALAGATPGAIRTALSRARKKVRDIYLKNNI
ncbi:MAG: sigma-70 family RNA polymerase sigma factor [Paramuribaculum sp.]|nr:sigma-70 family RNA polymerase sigma factor [Paramuribaculum sp.]